MAIVAQSLRCASYIGALGRFRANNDVIDISRAP